MQRNTTADTGTGVQKALLLQFVKYSLAGGIATLVHIVVFHLVALTLFPALQESDAVVRLLGLNVPELDDATRALNSMLANGLTFIISNLSAYIMNVMWVFEPGRHRRSIEIGLFYLVSGVSLVVGTGLMGLLIRYFHLQTTIAFSANIISAVLINYAMRKFVIFKG